MAPSILVLVLSLSSLAACGGAAQPSPLIPGGEPTGMPRSGPAAPTLPPATASPTAMATAAATPAGGAITFSVSTGSKAIVRVHEQLADRNLPSDAVLTTDKVTGEFTLLADGTFAARSTIVVDLTALSSDVGLRDDFVKRNTLDTRRFPQATFAPTRTEGLTLPLAVSGDLTFKLTGQMTIRDVTKELTFDVVAKRNGAELTATAKVTPAFQFGTFGMSQPRVFSVISIKDEIRLDVELVARQH